MHMDAEARDSRVEHNKKLEVVGRLELEEKECEQKGFG